MKITKEGFAVIDNDLWISKWAQETGRLDHDQNLLPVILPYINEGDYVIDGGAFIGDHTIAYLNKVGPYGIVFAFEPNPKAFQCLSYNCPNAVCFNMGLGFKTDKIAMVESGNAGASYLVPNEGSNMVMALDSISIPKLNFLKLDIEGMELRALQGAEKAISKHKPIILLEINRGALARWNTTPEVLIGFLEAFGYRQQKVYESDSLDAPQFDLLFIPK